MAYPVQADPTAVFGRRVLAALIDGALILIPVIMLLTSQFEYLDVDSLPVDGEEFCDDFMDTRNGFCVDFSDVDDRVYFSDGAGGATWAVYWGATFGMFVILQGLTGWSIGKLVTGIRVVQEDGRPAGIVKALVRWLLWIVDAFPYVLPLVGFIVGLSTVGHRRVGDMVAKTFVVSSSAAGSPIVVPGLTASPPVGSTGAWGVPPPTATGATTGWGQAVDPSSAGWAAPTPAPTPTADAPQWDAARGTYIQWDATQGTWMQWDEAAKTWSRIPGQ
jgi:uncharacterized RDD family membrane protein YckC